MEVLFAWIVFDEHGHDYSSGSCRGRELLNTIKEERKKSMLSRGLTNHVFVWCALTASGDTGARREVLK